MKRDIHLHFDLRLTRRTMVAALAAAVLAASTADLDSEGVTLTTYYPAPSGVYTKMLITGNTYLARSQGSVGIGTTDPKAKLHVNGAAAIDGATTINGAASVNGDAAVSGAIAAASLSVSGNVSAADVLAGGKSVLTGVSCSADTGLACSVSGNTLVIGKGCVSNGSCSAAEPDCEQTTYGQDNCRSLCSKVGGKCAEVNVCVPDGSCTAPPPNGCGQYTYGVDNCGNLCSKYGGDCGNACDYGGCVGI